MLALVHSTQPVPSPAPAAKNIEHKTYAGRKNILFGQETITDSINKMLNVRVSTAFVNRFVTFLKIVISNCAAATQKPPR